jgi:hypothetical protein
LPGPSVWWDSAPDPAGPILVAYRDTGSTTSSPGSNGGLPSTNPPAECHSPFVEFLTTRGTAVMRPFSNSRRSVTIHV